METGCVIEEFETFYAEWVPKMRKMAYKTFIKDSAIDKEDVFQELAGVLWKCFNSYNPDSGVQFNTYFYTAAKNQIYMMLCYSGAKKRAGVKVSLDFYSGEYYDNKISEAAFKLSLFQRIKDRQVQAAVEYLLDGGDLQDLPSDIIRQLKKHMSKTWIRRNWVNVN